SAVRMAVTPLAGPPDIGPHLSPPPTQPEINPPSLHAALPISACRNDLEHPRIEATARDIVHDVRARGDGRLRGRAHRERCRGRRSEEHTSELQSREKIVCRPMLEKKKNKPLP